MRTTPLATLPNNRRLKPERPWVPITIKATSQRLAPPMITLAARSLFASSNFASAAMPASYTSSQPCALFRASLSDFLALGQRLSAVNWNHTIPHEESHPLMHPLGRRKNPECVRISAHCCASSLITVRPISAITSHNGR